MVVFQYGSAVLFNIDDHEIETYLEVVRRYASGLLPEMRKDGKLPFKDLMFLWVVITWAVHLIELDFISILGICVY